MRLMVYGDIGGSEGYVRYCKFLFGNDLIPDDVEIWFVCSPPFYERLGPLAPEVHVITHPWMVSLKRLYRSLWCLWIFPKIIRKIKPDLEFYAAGQLRVYLRKAVTVTACHNQLYFDEQEFERIEKTNEKDRFHRNRINHINSLRKSDGVIFFSGYSQAVVCGAVPAIKDSTVIAHGLDPIFLQAAKSSYELGQKIKLLYVSPVHPHKHHSEVIKAVKMLRETSGCDIHLDLLGGGDRAAFAELAQFIEAENAGEFVNLAGNVDYNELPEHYRAADIFVFASSSETFGITILEAMGAGLPIACSDRGVLPDILKDAGVYFDPEDPQGIADAVQKLIDDLKLRKTLGEKARLYASGYTWERCAEETFAYLRKIAGKAN